MGCGDSLGADVGSGVGLVRSYTDRLTGRVGKTMTTTTEKSGSDRTESVEKDNCYRA